MQSIFSEIWFVNINGVCLHETIFIKKKAY